MSKIEQFWLTVDQLNAGLRLLVRSNDWRVDACHTMDTDAFEVRVRPFVSSLIHVPISRIEYLGKSGLVDYLQREVRAVQENMVDMLDKSIGRKPRVGKPLTGCCEFCGAPYTEKP